MGLGSKHTDVHIAESGKAFPEFLHFGLIGFGLIALLILGRALLLNVESQVLEEDYSAPFSLFDNLLNLGTNAVWCKSDRLPEKLLKLGNDRFQAVLVVQLAIGPTQVGHEDDSLSAIVNGILDGGDGTSNTLVVGDFFVGIEGDVEVDLDVR